MKTIVQCIGQFRFPSIMRGLCMAGGGFLLLSILAGGAMSAPTTLVHAMKIQGLSAFAGHSLTVFYVSARESSIGGEGQTPVVRSIKSVPLQVEIPSSGELVLPAVAVSRSGFDVLNYLVLGVRPSQLGALFIRNPDGSVPADPRVSSAEAEQLQDQDFSTERLAFLPLASFPALTTAGSENAVVAIDFGTLLH